MKDEIVEIIKEIGLNQEVEELVVLIRAVRVLKPIQPTQVEELINDIKELDENKLAILMNVINKMKWEKNHFKTVSKESADKLIKYVEIEDYFM